MASINTLLAANVRNCSRGAPMGDHGHAFSDAPKSGMRCERLRMVDGAYGPDGTYWGCGSREHGHMYVCFNGENVEYKTACGFLKYYRAKTRADAIAQCLEDYPGLTFARGHKVKTETVTLPAYWASALINSDASGLSNTEFQLLDGWLTRNPEFGACLSCSDESFIHRYDGRLSDCLEYVFPLKA